MPLENSAPGIFRFVVVVLLCVNVHGISGPPRSVEELRGAVISAIESSLSFNVEEDVFNTDLFRAGIDTRGNNGDHRHMHGVFRYLMARATPETRRCAVALAATTKLSTRLGMSIEQLRSNPVIAETWLSLSHKFCRPRPVKCLPIPFRTADGSCNNLNRPRWGQSDRAEKRYLPSVYSDGIGHPRKFSITGKPLPNPRVISKAIHRTARSGMLEPRFSIMVMNWGQNLDHDVIDTPTMKGFQNSDITCCGLRPDVLARRSACFVIPIPPHDPHFTTPCMNFVRSAPAGSADCAIGRRQQLNQQTSYIDGSYIYGSDIESMAELRHFKHGFLKMGSDGMFVPSQDQSTCIKEFPHDYCMKSGDMRIHVVPGLTTLQVTMMREHNRIAHILGSLNPHWNDERIYQETRKIMAAFAQHITYTEFLPKVLGPLHMKRNGLWSTRRGYNTVYNPKVDATISNVFGVAALRFGHSLIPENVDLLYKGGKKHRFDIEETFNRPFAVLEGGGRGLDAVARAMLVDNTARSDRFLEAGVVDNLFLDNMGMSFDLAALNIQRGRDHAIPGYNAWRRWCGLRPAFHFGHAPGGLVDVDPQAAHTFSKLYKHPDDIDLFPAAMSERHLPGAAVGPTFACILSRQFRDLKVGDRFWYENNFPATGFTPEQLNEIKTIRLSKILCKNLKLKFVARDAFHTPFNRNPEIPCKHLRNINFNFWRERPPSLPRPIIKAPFTVIAPLKYW